MAVATLFVACAYPDRLRGVEPRESKLRVKQFIRNLKRFGEADSAEELDAKLAAANAVWGNIDQGERARLVDGLGGVESVYGGESVDESKRATGLAEIESRRRGALLFLATCAGARPAGAQTDPPGSITNVLRNWRQDGELVGFVRGRMNVPPSAWAVRGANGRPIFRRGDPDSWDRLQHVLCAEHPDWPRDHVRTVVFLEQRMSGGRAPDEGWNRAWEKLTSGFPYFGFQSRFASWWPNAARPSSSGRRIEVLIEGQGGKGNRPRNLQDDIGRTERQILSDRSVAEPPENAGHPPPSRESAGPPDGAGADPSNPRGAAQWESDLELLRELRELYRVVRGTYTGSYDNRLAGPDRVDAAARSQARKRQLVDLVWEARLSNPGGHNLPRGTVARIMSVARDAGLVPRDLIPDAEGGIRIEINMIHYHLHLRMRAGYLARALRWADTEICAALFRRDPGNEAVRAVQRVACLVKSVPRSRVLLWPLIADRLLYPVVRPQTLNPFGFRDFLHELAWWVREPWFGSRVDRGGAELGGPPDKAARDHSGPGTRLQELWDQLAGADSAEAAARLIDRGDFDGHCADIRAAAEQFMTAGPAGPGTTPSAVLMFREKARVARWRAVGIIHFVIPLWYVIHVERLGGRPLEERLALGSGRTGMEEAGRVELKKVRELAMDMLNWQ